MADTPEFRRFPPLFAESLWRPDSAPPRGVIIGREKGVAVESELTRCMRMGSTEIDVTSFDRVLKELFADEIIRPITSAASVPTTATATETELRVSLLR